MSEISKMYKSRHAMLWVSAFIFMPQLPAHSLVIISPATPELVTNANDSGAGSLRQALQNSITGDGLVLFMPALDGQTITLFSGDLASSSRPITFNALNNLTTGVTIVGADYSNSVVTHFYGNLRFDGAIQGTGALFKTLPGKLVLNGNNTYSGTTFASGGTLQIGDENHSGARIVSDVFVSDDAVLSGYGTIVGNVTNAGNLTNCCSRVQPGGSSGALRIDGDYTQGVFSVLDISLEPSGSSKLEVTGIANINGIIALTFVEGVYTPAVYEIVSAGSIIHNYGVSIVTPQNFVGGLYSMNLEKTDQSLRLILKDETLAASPSAGIFNVGATAQINASHQASAALFEHLDDMDNDSNNQVSDFSSQFSATTLGRNITNSELGHMVAAAPAAIKELGGWVKAYGRFGSVNSSNTAYGFNSQTAGFMLGAETAVSPGLVVGVASGYEHTHSSLHSPTEATGQTSAVRLAIYGRKSFDNNLRFDAFTGYALHMLDNERVSLGATAKGNNRADEISLGSRLSYPFTLGNTSLTPDIGFNYVRVAANSYLETGPSALKFNVSAQTTHSARLLAGVKSGWSFGDCMTTCFKPETYLRYSYEAADAGGTARFSVNGGHYSLQSVKPSRHALNLGAKFAAKFDNNLEAYAAYAADLPVGNNFGHNFSLGAKLHF